MKPSVALERAALLLIASAACFAYAWRMSDALLEQYYAAAVRSMSLGWRNFAFAAFDPDGTITLDKLPGALWLQALSVRLFGVHVWAIVLPQVIEGVLTILVLHRAVRRLAGPVAGLTATAIVAASPVNVLLNRGNISDTLLILLLVLAADATSSAIRSGRTLPLALAGMWVGLGFQAKMLAAWLVLPALGLAFVLAAPGSLRRRIVQLGAAGLVTVVVSLSWMVCVSMVSPASRPYVDGSTRNSIFEQVFAYNGFRRIGGWSPLADLAQLGLGNGAFDAPPAAWHRLLTGPYGHATGWMIPAALMVLAAALVARRAGPRTDPIRAGFVLWGAWLIVFGAAFSATSTGWPYYAAVLSPSIGALLGMGLELALRNYRSPGTTPLTVVGVVVAITVAYAAWLLPGEGTGLPSWLRLLVVSLGALTEILIVATVISGPARIPLGVGSLICATGAVLVVPTVASVAITSHALGPFDTPFQSEAKTHSTRTRTVHVPELRRIERMRGGAHFLLATQPGGLASKYIFHGGYPVLPIGGLTGTIPEPSLAKLASRIAKGELHLVISVPSEDPRYVWIASHCTLKRRLEKAELHYCRASDARPALP